MNKTSSTMNPLQLRLTPIGTTGYKSISTLSWDSIPPFAIVTGRNGSGKSQLLLSLAHLLNNQINAPEHIVRKLRLEVVGDTFLPGDVAFIPQSGEYIHSHSLTIADLRNLITDQFKHLRELNHTDLGTLARRRWVEKRLGKDITSISAEEFATGIADNLSFMLEDDNVIYGLVYVFLGHIEKEFRQFRKGKTKDEILKILGPAPWDVLNEILAAAEFPYRVEAPKMESFLDLYTLEFRDQESGQKIRAEDFSSGEKVILKLGLWLYSSKNHERFPRLFLLDEPDAHLHPSMMRQFMNVLNDVLVERYKVRVIMSTHSPSTIAQAPEGAIFEMRRGAPRIFPSSKENAIGLLTSGLIVVSPTTRMVIVEDKADVTFYQAIQSVLTDYGPSKDTHALAPAPSIIFLPASSGKNESKIAGGKTAVLNWVEKFKAPPFNELVWGLIDKDSGNVAQTRVLVTQRYSIENYLLDPLIIFGLLIEAGTAPAFGTMISRGDEHLIRTLDDPSMQTIVGLIQARIEPELGVLSAAERATDVVQFTNGRKINYPNWMITKRGHDLLPIYQNKFGGTKIVSPPRLTTMLQRIRLVPIELAQILHHLQKGA